ncbi:hypothetical protein BCU90_11070 [Vibrio lentus]|uniref:hypothetical protein n=1 Tax=Vibrio TaxID=662 RepID=UPI000C844B51|nr:hypothetical protein [Vibrio lentus]PMG47590.1 hypothetical protein BCU90_11070 [Vibrio lentus]PMI73598.1 hypothetical protein BCU38_17335 [Vibrio splendidus]
MSIDPMYYYLSDGVYWNWDAKQDVELSRGDGLTSEYEAQIAEEIVFSKSFTSSEAYRSHHFFKVLTSNMPYMANRYCQYENLSKDYAEVAMQKNVLKDIVFVHSTNLSISFTLAHIKKLDVIVLDIYNNINRNTVYNRVGTLQSFLHECTLAQGKQISRLDIEVMRKLLSLCRLHIAISDVRKKSIDLIKEELFQNNLDSKGNSHSPYVSMLKKQYIPNWKKRHLRSLLHFCPQVEREVLKGLISLKQPFNNVAVQEIIFKKYK